MSINQTIKPMLIAVGLFMASLLCLSIILGSLWGGSIKSAMILLMCAAVLGFVLCRKAARAYPRLWWLWGGVFAFPLCLFGFGAGFSAQNEQTAMALMFWRSVGIVGMLSSFAGAYWGRKT